MFQYALLLSNDLNPNAGQAQFFVIHASNVRALIRLGVPLGATQR